MAKNIFDYCLLIASCFAVGFVYLGWRGYYRIISNNPCEMTYSSPGKTEINIPRNPWKKYKLRKVTNSRSRMLNSYPVLFIPGHLGSGDQARSFAAQMHNEDNLLQYFTIDFSGEVVGVHGSDVLTKADFVNNAIVAIKKLYQDEGLDKQNDLQIAILGHSYGGIIAKASFLLNSHPSQCPISEVVTLGTPHTKAPIGADSTLVSLYRDINKAWFSAFYCSDSELSRSRINSLESSVPISKLAMHNGSCSQASSRCITSTRMISVSGGTIDNLVQPELTDLFTLSAHPRNVTSRSNKPAKKRLVTLELIQVIKDFMKEHLLNTLLQYADISRAISYFSGGVANSTVKSEVSYSPASLNETSSTEFAEEESMEEEVYLDPSSPFAFLTRSNWKKDIQVYTDPWHISISSMQLDSEGNSAKCVIDHAALLWCRHFVSAINSGIKLLAKIPSKQSISSSKAKKSKKSSKLSSKGLGEDLILVRDVFPIDSSEIVQNAIDEVSRLNISQLSSYAQRRSLHELFKSSAQSDLQYMRQLLGGNELWLSSVVYFVKHLYKVPIWFFILSVFVLITKVSMMLFGVESENEGKFKLLVDMKLYSNLWESARRRYKQLFPSILVGISAGLVGHASFFQGDSKLSLLHRIKDVISSTSESVAIAVIAVSIALFFRMLVLVSLTLFRCACSIINHFWRLPMLSSVHKVLRISQKSFFLLEILTGMSLLFAVIVVRKESFSELFFQNGFVFSFLLIWLFLLIVLVYFWGLLCGVGVIEQKSDRKWLLDEFTLVYLVFIITALPSALFSWQQLFNPSLAFIYSSHLFDSFGPDRINYAMTMLFGWLNLRGLFVFCERMKITKMPLLADFVNDLNPKAVDVSKTVCIHEDGGPDARFELFESPSVEPVKGRKDILIGNTYRVVWCNCALNPKLKSYREWCEWCTCYKCSGFKGESDYSRPEKNQMSININLLLVASMCALLGYQIYLGEQHHLLLYFSGTIGFVFYLRSFFRRNNLRVRF